MSIKCCSISRKSMPAKDWQVWICTFSTALFCKDAIGVVRISFRRTRSAVFTTMKMSLDAIKPPLSFRRVRRAAVLSLRSHCEALVCGLNYCCLCRLNCQTFCLLLTICFRRWFDPILKHATAERILKLLGVWIVIPATPFS